jgi:hypothetical protein
MILVLLSAIFNLFIAEFVVPDDNHKLSRMLRILNYTCFVVGIVIVVYQLLKKI